MRPVLLVALAAALWACTRPEPSPEYQEAVARYREVMARHPDEPWLQPELDRVLELLDRVPHRSLDAEAAGALRQRIVAERAIARQEEQRRTRLVEAAGRPTPAVPERADPAEAAATPTAAPATSPLPGLPPPGTPLADFQRTHGDCFEARAAARIGQPAGGAVDGEAWALKDLAACRTAHPAAAGQLLLFAGGKLLAVRPASAAREEVRTEVVQGARQPDGSMAVVGPDGAVRSLPPGATVQWREGAPAEAGAATAGSAR